MSSTTSQRRGFCPSLWLPMQSGDGLIVRVRAGAGRFSSKNVRDLARFAAEYGNGQLELTRRANLQLRGIREPSLPLLQRALVELGLAQPTAELDARLALVVDPLSGLDAGCAALEPLAGVLTQALLTALLVHALPSKFCVVLEGGGGALNHVAADIRVRVVPQFADRVWLYAGGTAAEAIAFGACSLSDAPAALLSLVDALCEASAALGGGRMRDVIAAHGPAALHARLAPRVIEPAGAAPRPAAAQSLIGCSAQPGAGGYVGIGLPFGAGELDTWRVLADLADTHGNGELRMTASRSVLLPIVQAAHARAVMDRASQCGLITDPHDPLLRVSACPGAPACQSARGETRALARKLARVARPLLDAHTTLHVSGCSKSCAWSGSAEITVVHSESGTHLAFGSDAVTAADSGSESLANIERRLAGHSLAPRVGAR